MALEKCNAHLQIPRSASSLPSLFDYTVRFKHGDYPRAAQLKKGHPNGAQRTPLQLQVCSHHSDSGVLIHKAISFEFALLVVPGATNSMILENISAGIEVLVNESNVMHLPAI